MRTFPWILIVLVACALLIASCATSAPPPVPVPPRREMPATALKACVLPRLMTDAPTLGQLEDAYTARGAALLKCDGARQLAVDVHQGEHDDEDAWLEALE